MPLGEEGGMKPLVMLGLLAMLAANGADSHPASLVGDYDGGQMEMAAGLSLKADGRFDYGLSYGALDEEAHGRWSADDRQVLLTSDPVTPPRFSVTGQQPSPPRTLRITLALPGQLNRQYFDAHVRLADGHTLDQQLGMDDTAIPFDPGNPPVSIVLSLGVFDLASAPYAIDAAKGYQIDFRFDPNDLGKVDFRGAPLRREGVDLMFDRYGRTIRFHRVER